jgi:hypothetical protein
MSLSEGRWYNPKECDGFWHNLFWSIVCGKSKFEFKYTNIRIKFELNFEFEKLNLNYNIWT